MPISAKEFWDSHQPAKVAEVEQPIPPEVQQTANRIYATQGFAASSKFLNDYKAGNAQPDTIAGRQEQKPILRVSGPLAFTVKPIQNIVHNTRNAFNDEVQRLNEVQYSGGGGAKNLGKVIRAGVGAANVVFAPISSVLSESEKVPVFGKVVKYGINKPFEWAGNAGSWVGKNVVNNLPISEDAKNQLREPIQELTALVAQIALGKAGHVAGTKIFGKGEVPLTKTPDLLNPSEGGGMPKPSPAERALSAIKAKLTTKTQDRLAATGEVTPGDAKVITNEVMKETPVESKGTVPVPTPSGETIKVVTNQKLVLENFLKGREDVTYKRVKGLGTDANGNVVQARFQWDYKKQEATIYTTSRTTASNLAHEIGHYFDQKLSLNIAERFSEIIPDYLQHKQEVKDSLAQYAVDTLDGNATPQDITARVRDLTASFTGDIKNLAAKEKRAAPTEQFASAVREVLLDPQTSATVAPEFTRFVQYFSDKQGLVSDTVKKPTSDVIKVDAGQNLSPEEMKIEQSATQFAQKYTDQLYNEYKKKFGKELNTDNARELFADYSRSKESRGLNAAAVHEPSNALIKEFYKRELEANKGQGNDTVLFTAGGTGAGKSTAVRNNLGKEYERFPIVYDTNLSTLKSAVQKIDQAIKSGYSVVVDYVYRDPVESFNNGSLPRAERMGRTVPINEHVKTHIESRKVIQQLMDHYKNDSQVTFKVINNSRGKGRAINSTIDELPNVVYDKGVLEGNLKKELDNAYTTGKISTATYRGTISRTFEEGKRGDSQPSDKGIGGQPQPERVGEGSGAKGRIGPTASKSASEANSPTGGLSVQPARAGVAKTGVVEGQFAATGLKTGETVKGRVAFNPEKINAPEDVQQLIGGVSKMSGEFSKQRISKSDANVQALAQEVGINVDDLMKLQPGSIANAETVFKARQIVSDLGKDLRDTIRGITTEAAKPDQLLAVKNKLLRLQGAMKAVAGLRTEAANVFRQFKIESIPGENDIMTDLLSHLKKLDSTAGEDLSAFVKGSKELLEPTAMDKSWHLWYMSILSGGSTQIKNMGGNLGNMFGEVAVQAITDPKGFRDAMTGLWQGLVEGKTLAGEILKKGDVSKLEETGKKPIVFTLGSEKASGASKVIRQAGAKVLNSADYVGRFMSAMDVWARTGFKGMELRAQAHDIAVKEGLSGLKLVDRIDELTSKPTEQMIEVADQFAQRGTYTQKPTGVLGAISSGVSGLTRKVPAVRLIIPFSRIVANVLNNSIDWTPVGFLRAFGKDENGLKLRPRARNQELGRAVLGTVAMTYVASLAADGLLSGNGPLDIKKKEQLQATGWRPNSIKIGDKWFPYQNWGPLAVPFSLVGNYFDYQKYETDSDQNATARVTVGILNSVNSILSMSFLSGMDDLVTALHNLGKGGEKYFTRFAAQQITSPVPNIVKQSVRYFDTTQYQTNDIKEQILNNLRITTGLKPKVNVFGDVVKGEALTQLQPVSETKDPLIKYLAANDLWVSVPSKATKVYPPRSGDKGRPMTEDEYYNYVKYSGKEIKKQLTQQLKYIQSQPTEKRQDYIDGIVKDVRDGTKTAIEMGVYK